MAPTVWTTGYEQHRTPARLVAALQAAGVARLVDVRELPLSRRRGFSKTALRAALADAGIEYEHEKALGNPKPLRDLYKPRHPMNREAAGRCQGVDQSAPQRRYASRRIAPVGTDEGNACRDRRETAPGAPPVRVGFAGDSCCR